eukprot:CAMPEP_0113881774 /NCGR_PEP_ID=MMETSP0780_2-20120614/8568_1 /TAXON_ID=652834 /ORGANISM="Palpitomonas bilix" /LENGTH=188 /DNA_ID=CAMNT_0000868679 /DNA_START=100 /DNA_END=666 /DNA_ORIENTATION=+ /assembly_acc=CAM_ASM_000599
MAESRNTFLLRTKENADFNQYWYSPRTIETIVREVETNAKRAAFLSTPSVYFSLKNKELKENSVVFDLDEQWSSNPCFVRWDFNEPTAFPDELAHTFDFIVVDPPFITREVWEKYTEATKKLLKNDGTPTFILLTTIQENKDMMKELLDVEPQAFLPGIPNLVYQYSLYVNYESEHLQQKNPDIPDFD